MTTQTNNQNQNLPALKSNHAIGKTKQKPMTEAFKKLQAYRDEYNPGRKRILADDLSCVVYIYKNSKDQPCARAYRGRAKKHTFHYCFSSEETRDEKVKNWMNEQQAEKKSSASNRMERELKVDDVLVASWGYEQTNIDYYKVTKLIGKTMVEIVEIDSIKHETGYMQGKCFPRPEQVIGESMRRKVSSYDGRSLSINSFTVAALKEPESTINGLKSYKADYWTSYY